MVAKLSDYTIKHILRWASSVWEVYVHEILSYVVQASTSSFYIVLGTQNENHDGTYNPQAYYGDDIL